MAPKLLWSDTRRSNVPVAGVSVVEIPVPNGIYQVDCLNMVCIQASAAEADEPDGMAKVGLIRNGLEISLGHRALDVFDPYLRTFPHILVDGQDKLYARIDGQTSTANLISTTVIGRRIA